jgi:thimet oligopeptidase
MDGASTTTVRPPVSGVQLGEVIVRANLPSDENACSSYQEVTSLLHQMGHCVHALLGKQRYERFAGLACETDFVKAPSQMLELWLANKNLYDFAINEQGQRIPESVLDKLISAQGIGRAVEERFHIFLSKLAVSSARYLSVITRWITFIISLICTPPACLRRNPPVK